MSRSCTNESQGCNAKSSKIARPPAPGGKLPGPGHRSGSPSFPGGEWASYCGCTFGRGRMAIFAGDPMGGTVTVHQLVHLSHERLYFVSTCVANTELRSEQPHFGQVQNLICFN